MEQASLLKLSKEEALWFFNNDNPIDIAESLSHRPSVIVTDGAKPIRWLLGAFSGETKAISSPASVVDTTGAGDSFTAGIISQLSTHSFYPGNKLEAEKIIRFATACGALVCGGTGAIDPQPSSSEVEKLLDSLEDDMI